MKDSRPISLSTTIYKIISKVPVNRMKHLLNKLIGPNKVSFVPGRSITDNLVLIQKVMNMVHRKKGKKAWMIWKVDLEKAYDKV